MNNKIQIYDRADLLQMYLDWFNNFLTVPRFAEYYGISEEFADEVVIPVGRETLNNQLADGKHIAVRKRDVMNFETNTEIAIYLVCDGKNPYHRDVDFDTYQQLQHQLNYENSYGVFKNEQCRVDDCTKTNVDYNGVCPNHR